MSTIEIRVTESTTVESFAQDVAAGKVKFYRVRGNGTTRHVPFFAAGTKEREEAEWVLEQREDGRTMREIADELHLSVPSVRRMINSALLSDEVDEYESEDIEDLLAEAKQEETSEAVEESAPATE
jgi:hypothetical protein